MKCHYMMLMLVCCKCKYDFLTIFFSETSNSQFLTPWFRHVSYNNTSELTQNWNPYSVTHIKFLGLTIDHTLSWKLHIESLTKRLTSVAYAIRSLKYILPKETLKMIYFNQGQSITNYGIIFWGQSSEASKVFIMRKNILRIIYNLKPTDTCRNLFMQNHIMTLFSYYIYTH